MTLFMLGFLASILMTMVAIFAGLSSQGWIALDQYLSCRLNKFAWADETYSARCWRRRLEDPVMARRVKQIDFAFRLFGFGPDHCQRAYKSEFERKQNAPEYRK